MARLVVPADACPAPAVAALDREHPYPWDAHRGFDVSDASAAALPDRLGDAVRVAALPFRDGAGKLAAHERACLRQDVVRAVARLAQLGPQAVQAAQCKPGVVPFVE